MRKGYGRILCICMGLVIGVSLSCLAADDADEGFVKRMLKKMGKEETTPILKPQVPAKPVAAPEKNQTVVTERAPQPEQTSVTNEGETVARTSTATWVSISPTTQGKAGAKKVEPYTKEDREFMVDVINEGIQDFGDALANRVRGIVKLKNEKGEAVYKYKRKDGTAVDFIDLDDATLEMIYNRVNNEATVARNERLTDQLHQISTLQQVQEANRRQQEQQRTIQRPADLPRTAMPPAAPAPVPSLPQQVTTPPQAPNVYIPPQPPPRPPERR